MVAIHAKGKKFDLSDIRQPSNYYFFPKQQHTVNDQLNAQGVYVKTIAFGWALNQAWTFIKKQKMSDK